MNRRGSTDVIPYLLNVDRALAAAGTSKVRDELLPVRRLLEDFAGKTVQPAEAARMLEISQPALKRWLDSGEIATVMTPEGRREIPTEELVSLLDGLEDFRKQGSKRPLARLVRQRRQEAEEVVDVKRLLPPRRLRGHRTAELHSLAYHRLVAERLNARLVDLARQRLERWREDGRIDPRWADKWARLLAKPVPEIQKRISADSSQARELRQTSPFAGVLTTQERNELFKAVEARAAG
jgi:hypothetical protein